MQIDKYGKKTVLGGLWDFGYSQQEELPQFNAVSPLPVCADAMTEFLGQEGYAAFRTRVRVGGMVRLTLTCGLHSRILWDGQEKGRSVLAYTREEYDFDAGPEGEHELIIVTDNIKSDESSAVFRPFYDFYGYNGVYDHVVMQRLLPGVIDRIRVEIMADIPGTVKLHLDAAAGAPESLEISFDGKKPQSFPFAETLLLQVPDWQYWSPEKPHLHKVDVNGTEAEFGIRLLNWQGRRLLLNGQPVKLLGVNRHEAHPEFGSATPESLIWNDLLSIKRQGFNFIRGAHYPQKEFMLQCADKLGLLVWEEALAWGNTAEDLTDPLFGDRQEEQCRKMVQKSFNHPSVICWGFLNECAGEAESSLALITRLRDVIKSLDPTRPVTFATCRPAADVCIRLMDIISVNTYPDWYGTNATIFDPEAIGRVLHDLAELFPEKPLIISEIGCGALYGDHSGFRWSEEWAADYMTTAVREICSRDDYSGVSLWQYCDTRTCQTTHHCPGTPRGFNNKGLVNEYRLPKLAWKALKKLLADRGRTLSQNSGKQP